MIDGAEAIVPAVWRLDVVNALVVAERRKKITPGRTAKFLHNLEQFKITIDLDGLDHAFGAVLDQARLHQRSSCDASYLELAMPAVPQRGACFERLSAGDRGILDRARRSVYTRWSRLRESL